MLNILTSSFAWLMRWLVGAGGIKLLVFGAIYAVLAVVYELIKTLIPAFDLQAAFDLLPDFFIYFVNWLLIPTGIALVGGAKVARFLVRRLPVVG